MIKISNLKHYFAGNLVLDDINLELNQKQIAIIGANGSGKSTFARMLNGLLEPSSGEVLVDDVSTKKDRKNALRKVGFIFQNPDNQIVYPIVEEDLAFGLKNLKLDKKIISEKISVILEKYNISHLKKRFTYELSGGEKQLIAICGVLLMQPQIIIFDEPTTLLDLKNKHLVAQMINDLKQQVILITHDLDLIKNFDRVIAFDKGKILADDNPKQVISIYKTKMLESL